MQIPVDYTTFKDAIRVKTDADKRYIFGAIRKKFLVLTPEELVRQLVIQYLIQAENISKNRINVEKALHVNGLLKRFDILIYAKDLSPFLLVECKAPKVPINQSTFDQIAQYNISLKVPYLLVTNGVHSYCCAIDHKTKSYTFLERLPSYPVG